MNGQEQLDVCPCCGKVAWVEVVTKAGTKWHKVVCEGCGLSTDIYLLASAAIGSWNKRVGNE